MDVLFQNFFVRDEQPTLLLVGSYEPWLVALSVAIAILAATMALQLAGLAQNASARVRQLALLGGSIALGSGIWSMHFIGMLALNLCTEVNFDVLLTSLSVVPSLIASRVALGLLTHPESSKAQVFWGSLLIALGISLMHYCGMAAMRLSAIIQYDKLWFFASLLIGWLLSLLALWVRFDFAKPGQSHIPPLVATCLSGCIMGGAIAGMHYLAMAAARFSGPATPDYNSISENSYIMALAIALAAISMSMLSITATTLQRLRDQYRLRERSESRLKAIIDTATEGIITTDINGFILSLSHSAERLFGWTSQEVQGRHVNLLLPDVHALQYDLHEHLTAPLSHQTNPVGYRKDGSTFAAQLVVGKTTRSDESLFVGFVSDLTEQKAMEQELRQREQQYRTLIANIPGVTFRRDADGELLLFISEAIERLSGWPASSFLQEAKSFIDLVHPEDRKGLQLAMARTLNQGQPYVLEYRLFCRDGRERWVSESACGVRDEDGWLTWIDGVLIDITDSKLKNAEFEGIVNAINRALAVVEFDLSGRIQNVNENFRRLSGYRLSELQGRYHSVLCFPEESESTQYLEYWRLLRGGEFVSGEFRRRTKDGRELWIHATYNPIFDADHIPRKIVKFATDLSERRAMEVDLREAKERAEHAALVKSTFLANMSHEIRTPMNSIIGFSELLLDMPLEPTQRQHLTTIYQAARSLLTLLNAILDTAKLERGAVELEYADLSLRELCKHILASIRLDAERKGLNLYLEYPEVLPEFFYSDALRIKQLLLNLLVNAIKFTEQGSVRVCVSQGAEGSMRLEIIDTGIGIPANRLEHIFDPFAQAASSIPRRFGGTGLGTTIARQLTELLGGHIGVNSTEGQGSRFWVELPLAPGQEPVHHQRTSLQLPALRILVADDVEQNRELLQLFLTKSGHQVYLVHNGQQAVELYQSQALDLILMDVQMPEMDGLEATRRIRAFEQQHQRPPVPIIALSASVLDADRHATRAAGMNDFSAKPADFAELVHKMAQTLGIESAMVVETPSQTATTASPAEPPLIDWSQGIRLWGDQHSFQHRAQQLLNSPTADLNPLREALTNNQPEVAQTAIHRLLGAAANLALPAIQYQAEDLERLIQTQHLTQALAQVPALSTLIQDSLEQLSTPHASALPEAPSKAPPEAVHNIPQLKTWIEEIEQALTHGELAESKVQQLLDALPEQLEFASFIEIAINAFDFEHAQRILAQLYDYLSQLEQQQTHL